MQAGILYRDRDIRLGQAPDPRIRPDQVLVKAGYAGICGTDVHIFRGEFHDRVPFPAVQGHEFGGTIAEVGKEVTQFRIGDRVAVDPILPCHECPACLAGRINACRKLKLLGVDVWGGLGEYVAVPRGNLFRLPDSVPMKHVPMVEVYALGHHILQRGQVQPGETVAILGAGKVGLAVLDVLCHGASPAVTFVTDVQPFRLATASKLGAGVTIDVRHENPVDRIMEMTDGIGVDCAIECVGHFQEKPGEDSPLGQAVKMIRHGGRVVTVGLGEQLSAVHFKTLVLKEAHIIASRCSSGEFARATRLMAKGLLHPDLLITHEIPLREVSAAFDRVDRDEPSTIKVVLKVEGS
jgi:2-desacetyl-2-hydroxyethyl bacteriochlorophyllide A dehydrogenase